MPYELEVIARECDGESSYPPLLFVHGSCHGAWCWDEHFLPYFAERGFDSYALSLRGHGESSGPGSLRWTSIAAYVADVEAVAADLRAEPVVIGHSLGGYVVQKYVEKHDPPGAVLIAPSPRRGMRSVWLRSSLRDPWPFLKMWLTLDPYALFATPERCHRFLFSPDMDEETVRRYWSRLGPESVRSAVETLGKPPDAERIRGRPMLILGAVEDRIVPEPPLRATAEDYGAELTMIPDMAHDMMLDTRWTQAADAIHDWLLRTLTAA
ncbi:MAG: lysophospholipase [Dehalococcoidia bacterium]|nr:lysophospholipase [Dehalococcoidia bacterium]MYA52400.1 lysophospholipase [Dehalococcoidia bacterium]